MNLDRITVKIRPRNQWEAIDMGFVVARDWFMKLWLLWLASALPFFIAVILLCFILPGSTLKWSLILFWFCKPLYEPPLLFWTSRALFGEQLTTRQTIKEIKRNTSFKRIITVCLSRFSLVRSFTLPVLILEGLVGKERQNRASLLSNGYETAIYLGVAGFFIEIILSISLISVCYWFIPVELRWVDFGDFIFKADTWLTLAVYFLACSILAPFYISSGFMLYISRRVDLEAWDIEIGFRQINKRLQKRKTNGSKFVAGLLLCSLITFSSFPGMQAFADELDPETAQSTITQVLKQKDFGENKTEYHWVRKQKETPETNSDWLRWLEPFFNTTAAILEKCVYYLAAASRFLVWLSAGCVLAFILLRYSRIRNWFSDHFQTRHQPHTPPKIMFGMDIRPESLPENITSACLELLKKREKRQVLSLLYRGTLSRFVNDHHIEIISSHTENECCNEIRRQRPEAESSYFNSLTASWLTTAYGHREPETATCRNLIEQWQYFSGE